MQPRHALGVTLILTIAAFAGAFAGFRSAALSTQARGATVEAQHASLAMQARQLDRYHASLRRLLGSHPPKLPRMPHFAPVPPPPPAPPPAPVVAVSQAVPAAAAAPQRVVYVRAHRVVVVHRHGGEHEHEGSQAAGHEGGGDD